MGAEESLFQKFGRDLPRGTVLFEEGQPGNEMYVVQSGRVSISKKVREVETQLATLGPGEFFGEMAIIANKPRNASARVAEDAKLLVIDPKTFESMIRGNSEIALRLIKKLAERLAEADAHIEILLLSDPGSRVVGHLLHLCEARGRTTDAGIEVEVDLDSLGAELGVGDVGITHMLDKLGRMGLIQRSGTRAVVPQVARLREFLQYLEMKWKFGDL